MDRALLIQEKNTVFDKAYSLPMFRPGGDISEVIDDTATAGPLWGPGVGV